MRKVTRTPMNCTVVNGLNYIRIVQSNPTREDEHEEGYENSYELHCG